MPTYDYQCRSCGSVTEVIHSMLEDGPSTCERCGGVLRRVLFPAGIIFKGSGFYRTDSRNGEKAAGNAKASKGSSSDSSSDSSGASGSSSSSGSGSGSESKPSSSPSSDAPKAADSSST